MHKSLYKFFNNKKLEATPLEQKLGSQPRVQMFAQFYAQNAEALAVVAAAELYEYVSNEKEPVNTEQVLAFKKGLGQICMLFEQCHREIEVRKASESMLESEDSPSDIGS